MITKETALQIQALVDGELTSQEAAEVRRQLSSDPVSLALHDELVLTRQVVRENEATAAVPESRDFYWSKIARGIEAQERLAPVAPRRPSLLQLLARWVVPAAAVIALTLFLASRTTSGIHLFARHSANEVETQLEDTSLFDFHDPKTGMTVVWLASNVGE